MRHKQPYSLLKRVMPSGKVVYYYRYYDNNGKRTTAKSTGQSTKSAAKTYVEGLIKNGLLSSFADKTLKEYTKTWWVWDECSYVRYKLSKGHRISPTHVNNNYALLHNHTLPFLGSYKINQITTAIIEDWLQTLHSDDHRNLSASTINKCLKNLKIIFSEAVRMQHITYNPADKIAHFQEPSKSKGILATEEALQLLNQDKLESIWNNDLLHYTINLLAASTGMRMGEIQGLPRKNVFEDHVIVDQTWRRGYGIWKEPKQGSFRKVPINSKLAKHLKIMLQVKKDASPDDLLFEGTKNNHPVNEKPISDHLFKALNNIGITEEDRKNRNITFHSWRHYFNTYMRGKIDDHVLRGMTGHSSEQMTDHYYSYTEADLRKIREQQENLI